MHTKGTGPKNRIIGANFENHLELQCRFNQTLFIKIPLGCRRVGPKRLIPVTSPFDFILIKNGISAFVDAKTFDQSRLSYSMMTPHQVNTLHQVHSQKAIAGYLVWCRDINQVIFYKAQLLFDLRPGNSLVPVQGLNLGPCERMNLDLLFNAGELSMDATSRTIVPCTLKNK